jgi:hypothetical protein
MNRSGATCSTAIWEIPKDSHGLGFALALARLDPAQSRNYVAARLRVVGYSPGYHRSRNPKHNDFPFAQPHLSRICVNPCNLWLIPISV